MNPSTAECEKFQHEEYGAAPISRKNFHPLPFGSVTALKALVEELGIY